MKRERYSYFVLFVEIAAIIMLHSAKSRQEAAGLNASGNRKSTISATYPVKVFPFAKFK